MTTHYCRAYISTAHGTELPEKRVSLYNQILKDYVGNANSTKSSSARTAYLWGLLQSKHPKLFTKLRARVKKQRSLGIPTLIEYLFPTPKCPECGHSVQKPSAGNLFCSSSCRSLHELGVTSRNQLPVVKQRKRETNLSRYGVEYPKQSLAVQETARANSRLKWGVDHPMQNPAVFERSMRANHRVKLYTYLGRTFECQSAYEARIFQKLADRYGINNVLTQFDQGFPDYSFQEMGTFPDLYVSSLDLFVEVKSDYTLLGTKGQNTLSANRKKAALADSSGNKLRWVVAFKRDSQYVLLPRRWYDMSTNYLRVLLN